MEVGVMRCFASVFLFLLLASLSYADWVRNTTLETGLTDVGANSAPCAFYLNDGVFQVISGESTAIWNGYSWNVTKFNANATIVSGITADTYGTCDVFNWSGQYHLIRGDDDGDQIGYTWDNVNTWVANTTVDEGLPDLGAGAYSSVSVWNYSGQWHLISSDKSKNYMIGYTWNGTAWEYNSTLNNTASITGPAMHVYYNPYLQRIEALVGKNAYGFYGYYWNGTAWVADASINDGLPTTEDSTHITTAWFDGQFVAITGNTAGTFGAFYLSYTPNKTASSITPASPWRGNNINCSVTYNGYDADTFPVTLGIAINGIPYANVTNSSVQSNVEYSYLFDTDNYAEGSNISCFSNASNGALATNITYTSNVTLRQSIQFNSLSLTPIYPGTNTTISCTANYSNNYVSSFDGYIGLVIDGVIDTDSNTSVIFTNNTEYSVNYTVHDYAGSIWEKSIACFATANDSNWEYPVQYSSTTYTNPDVNRWFPADFSIYNVRLNVSYPYNQSTYHCLVDTFPIDDSGVLEATFAISGAGVNITSDESDSIGSQDASDPVVWKSKNFTTNGTGTLTCNAIITDKHGTALHLNKSYYVGNAITGCEDLDICTVSSATNIQPGTYRYKLINITPSGSLISALTQAEETAYGNKYNLSSDTDIIIAGKIDLNGSGYATSYAGMSSGSLYLYANGIINQTATITGTGANGGTTGGDGKTGGSGLNIYVEAEKWYQSGAIVTKGGNGGANGGIGAINSGGAGGTSGKIQFKGREWVSTGPWNFTTGNGRDGADGGSEDCAGNGGASGATQGVYFYGFLNKTNGNVSIVIGSAGNGGDAGSSSFCIGGAGGNGGDVNLFYGEGRLYAQGFSISITTPAAGNGGKGDISDEEGGSGGDAGDGNLLSVNGTDVFWNISALSLTLGTGGNGGAGTVGGQAGDGGSWRSYPTSYFQTIECRDLCYILSKINLTGGSPGTPGAGGPAGAYGTNGTWNVWYNDTGTGNNFSYLLHSYTAYNFSGYAGGTWLRAKVPADTLVQEISKSDILALEFTRLNWTSTNVENRTLYYNLKVLNNDTKEYTYYLKQKTSAGSPISTNTSLTYLVDTNRFANGTYIWYIQEYTDYYRFTEWATGPAMVIGKATSNITGTHSDLTYDGSMTFTCNMTGYDIYNTTQFVENASYSRILPFGYVFIYVENNGTNKTFQTTYSASTDTYSRKITEMWEAGAHKWYCVGGKTNYHDSVYAGSEFMVGSFEARLPPGISSVKMVCWFPTMSNVQPIGQSYSTPIFTLINNNASKTANYTIRTSFDPVNGSIYFTNTGTRINAHKINSTANITICENVPYANTTACRIWLWADCLNASVVSNQNLSYIFGEVS